MVSTVCSPGKAVVTPAAEARIIYVSASTGDDNNDGLSPDSPVASISRGEQLVRDSSPDWMLLKRGDCWQVGLDDWYKRGRSAEQPMIIGAYGTGPRPLMKSATAFAPEMSLEFVSVIGVQFVADARLRAAASAASAASMAEASRRGHGAPASPRPGTVRRSGESIRPIAPLRSETTPPGHLADDSIITGAPLRSQPGQAIAASLDPAEPTPDFDEFPWGVNFRAEDTRVAKPAVAPRLASPLPPRIFSDSAAIAEMIPSPAEALRPVASKPAPIVKPVLAPAPGNRLGGVAPLAPLGERIARQSLTQPLRVKRIALARDDSSIIVTFTADVAAGIGRGDLLLQSTDGTIIDDTALSVTCDSTGRVATWTFTGLPGKVLPAGSWQVTLRAAIIDANGQSLDGLGDGVGGEDYVSPRRLISRGIPQSVVRREQVEFLPRRVAA